MATTIGFYLVNSPVEFEVTVSSVKQSGEIVTLNTESNESETWDTLPEEESIKVVREILESHPEVHFTFIKTS
jgi:hypothetical protein